MTVGTCYNVFAENRGSRVDGVARASGSACQLAEEPHWAGLQATSSDTGQD